MALPYVDFVLRARAGRIRRYFGNADLPSLYSELDYLAVPSPIEGGPVPLLEALASGCPVIAPTDIGLVEDFHIPFVRETPRSQTGVESLLQEKLRLRNCAFA